MKKILFSVALASLVSILLITGQNGVLLKSSTGVSPKVALPLTASADNLMLLKNSKPSPPTQERWVKAAIKHQMADISDAYEHSIQFPKYSKPLAVTDWNLLNPQAFIAKDRELDGAKGISAAIVLDRYVVNQEQDLLVKVRVSTGLDTSIKVEKISVYLADNSEQKHTLSLIDASPQKPSKMYSAVLAAQAFSHLPSGEKIMMADISFSDQQQAKVSAVFKLAANDATLTNLGEVYVEDAHLMIPAHFKVEKAGYYRVRANLFDVKSGKPVTHINAAFSLAKGDAMSVLKVHASTLRSQGFAGPYRLTDFNITHEPAQPGQKTRYGTSEKSAYQVMGFEFSHYSDEPYTNSQNQQRLEFLKKMATVH